MTHIEEEDLAFSARRLRDAMKEQPVSERIRKSEDAQRTCRAIRSRRTGRQAQATHHRKLRAQSEG